MGGGEVRPLDLSEAALRVHELEAFGPHALAERLRGKIAEFAQAATRA